MPTFNIKLEHQLHWKPYETILVFSFRLKIKSMGWTDSWLWDQIILYHRSSHSWRAIGEVSQHDNTVSKPTSRFIFVKGFPDCKHCYRRTLDPGVHELNSCRSESNLHSFAAVRMLFGFGGKVLSKSEAWMSSEPTGLEFMRVWGGAGSNIFEPKDLNIYANFSVAACGHWFILPTSLTSTYHDIAPPGRCVNSRSQISGIESEICNFWGRCYNFSSIRLFIYLFGPTRIQNIRKTGSKHVLWPEMSKLSFGLLLFISIKIATDAIM